MVDIESKDVLLARAWLRSGQAPAARAAEVARAMLVKSGQLPPTAQRMEFGADIEWALLADAEEGGLVELAAGLAQHARDKGAAKHAKKLLFRWKQRGVSVPERGPSRTPVDLMAQPDPLPSYISPVLADGMQSAMLGGWRPSDGPWVLVALMYDTVGLTNCHLLTSVSRTQLRVMAQRISSLGSGELFEAPEALVGGHLRHALDRADAAKRTIEGDAIAARQILLGCEPVVDLGFELDPDDDRDSATHLAAAAALAKDPFFAPYFEPLADSGDRWGTSATVTSASELARRLEFNAWLVAHRGHRGAALQAVVLARALRAGGDALRDVPWAQPLLARAGIAVGHEGAAPAEEESP